MNFDLKAGEKLWFLSYPYMQSIMILHIIAIAWYVMKKQFGVIQKIRSFRESLDQNSKIVINLIIRSTLGNKIHKWLSELIGSANEFP